MQECEFLNTIRHRSGIPGGTCAFDLPDYGYWLHLPASERRRQLETWIGKIRPLCDAVAEVLWLTREATRTDRQVAVGGFFQHNVVRNEQMNLIRVLLPRERRFLPRDQRGPAPLHAALPALAQRRRAAGSVDQDVRFLLAIC